MTPMIDILLVLLIIFMAVSPVSPRGLQAVAPEHADQNRPNGPDERTVAIVIARDGSLRLN